jgi:erythromycin esterase-like protein
MIAVEADWPDCATVNKYIHNGKSIIRDPLANFTRFPVWMWRNEVMQSFSEWMKDWNSRNQDDDLNFYGLDVYSLQK